MDYRQKYGQWLEQTKNDALTHQELLSIADDEKEMEERFYKDLAFGTGGLRGIIGAGTNRINTYTVGKATQGLANYIHKHADPEKKAVAIAYDSRNMSPLFASHAGLVLCANGIRAYVFESLRPTPELSFAVRKLGCTAGIVITASHNPPEYNGYKVYWEDGGQVPYPRDEQIIEEVNAVEDYLGIQPMELEQAVEKGLYITIGEEIDKAYIGEVKAQSLNREIIREMGESLSVVYTPLHGSGNIPVRRVLSEVGFKNVHVVAEQEMPDKNFTTVGYPNPEDPKAFTLAIALAKKVDADVIVGTDPDCDRVGVAVKDPNGDYVVLSGNMVGVLLTEYVLSQRTLKNDFPENAAVVKTIVSTRMICPICEKYGAALYDVLTGFKYIGEKIKQFEQTKESTYLFGFEESYGYLAGTYARDKDGVVASMLICELAAFYKKKGMTLYEGLEELYKTYGHYREGAKSITLKGIEGVKRIGEIMSSLRSTPPDEIAGKKVEWRRDYLTKSFTNLLTGEKDTSTLPASDVVHYTMEDGSWFCVRPSGTEPKLKLYYGIKGKDSEDALMQLSLMDKEADALIKNR